MSNLERFSMAQFKRLDNEVNDAHEIALHAEKVSRRIAKQVIKMVAKGESEATATRTIGENLNPTRYIRDEVSPRHDALSIELATNAALREDNINVSITPPESKLNEGVYVRGRSKVVINKIDGVDVSEPSEDNAPGQPED